MKYKEYWVKIKFFDDETPLIRQVFALSEQEAKAKIITDISAEKGKQEVNIV